MQYRNTSKINADDGLWSFITKCYDRICTVSKNNNTTSADTLEKYKYKNLYMNALHPSDACSFVNN